MNTRILPTIIQRALASVAVLAIVQYAYLSNLGLYGARPFKDYWYSLDPADLVDDGLILTGLHSKPTFLSTWGWWHECWAGTMAMPFWRPLTSQIWWIELHVFGPTHFNYFVVVTILSHFLAITLLTLVLRRLSGNWAVTILASYLFAGTRPDLLHYLTADSEPAGNTIIGWKNQPDIWAAAAILGSLLMALKGHWIATLVCVAAAICFKENGWLAFPMILILLASQRRLHEIPLKMYAAGVALSAILLLLRASAGHAVFVGFHQYANVNGFTKWLVATEGFYLNSWNLSQMNGAMIVTVIGVILLIPRIPFWPRFALILTSFIPVLWISARIHQTDMAAELELMFEPNILVPTEIQCALYLACVVCLMRDPRLRQSVIPILLLELLASVQMAGASQVTIHVMYLAYMFGSALVSLALMATYNRLVLYVRPYLPPVKGSMVSAEA